MANHLASEKSPYLQQHATNPVDWYPWGEAACARAIQEDKPIFLSIGYSTCHWCHVMARESFESERVAEILNESFVAIKVDREERPDIDRVYMAFVQATTGSGGWPLSVWLTPSLEPFFGGTYFPPAARSGHPGFVEILDEIRRLWREERRRIVESATALTEHLRELSRVPRSGRPPGSAVLSQAVAGLCSAFDPQHGGFGGAPKFPRPSELMLLFRQYARTGDGLARDAGLQTLRSIAAGGIHDHLGGGFHRYSVDAAWRVPHFEKMLYDQAQLVLACLDAYQLSADPEFADVAVDTMVYVRRDLADPAGGFCSAEDADSMAPGGATASDRHAVEGAFYLWDDAEVEAVLGSDADVFRARYGVAAQGNAPFDPHGEFRGKNLLHIALGIDDIASASGRTEQDVRETLGRSRARLFAARDRRPRPRRDDKVLTSWNGLMIAALARASRILGDQPGRTRSCTAAGSRWLGSARAAADFIRATMWSQPTGQLFRRYRDGQTAIPAYAEDYACLIFGLLELFQADADPRWLAWALQLQQRQDALFWDESDGGWFDTTGEDPSVLVRLKDFHDGAEPAASSVSVWNATALGLLTSDALLEKRAQRTLEAYGHRLETAPSSLPMMLAALAAREAGLQQIVIVGRPDADDTQALCAAVRRRFLPFSVVVTIVPGAHQEAVARLVPFVGPMHAVDGRATAYVCHGHTCRPPTVDAGELDRLLTPGRVT